MLRGRPVRRPVTTSAPPRTAVVLQGHVSIWIQAMTELQEHLGAGEGNDRPEPLRFSGRIDHRVVHDLHALFQRRVLYLEMLMLLLGIAGVALGGYSISAVTLSDDPESFVEGATTLATGVVLLGGWFFSERAWARNLQGHHVSGTVQGAGISVDQLDRASWQKFQSAWLSESAALLFTLEHESIPKTLALHGLPLHRNFFSSEPEWQQAREMIRKRIPKIRMVASE